MRIMTKMQTVTQRNSKRPRIKFLDKLKSLNRLVLRLGSQDESWLDSLVLDGCVLKGIDTYTSKNTRGVS